MVSRRRSVRTWRLRGRRGQVSAVATILGLLLVVTFIANYLTTTLPGQMSVNDLNHVVQVEDQVGRLSALLEAASAADAVGAQFSQPITLGSAGTPPFAGADAGSLGPATNGSEINVSLPIGGAWSYSAPTFGTLPLPNYANPGGGCTQATNAVTCTGTSTASTLYWNVSGTKVAYALTGSDGTYNFNVSDSGTSPGAKTTITLDLTGTGTMNVLVLGNNLSIPVTISDGGNVNLEIVGNWDTVTVTASHTGADVTLLEVGLLDSTVLSDAIGLVFLGNIAGTTDNVNVTTTHGDLSSATRVGVFYTSDNPSATVCPNGDGASSDYVTGGVSSTTHAYGIYDVTYNVTTLPITLTTAPPTYWTLAEPPQTPTAANCPLFVQASTPLTLGGQGSGLQVFLQNTYIASGDVALDEGAVAYGQEGSIPVMVDPPDFSASLTSTGALATASIWIPVFVGTIPVDYGISTSEFTMRLVSVSTLSFVSGSSLELAVGGILNVTVVSPYASAWNEYLSGASPWEFFYSHNDCSFPGGISCENETFVAGGPLGTLWMDLPITSAFSTFSVQIATFSVAVV